MAIMEWGVKDSGIQNEGGFKSEHWEYERRLNKVVYRYGKCWKKLFSRVWFWCLMKNKYGINILFKRLIFIKILVSSMNILCNFQWMVKYMIMIYSKVSTTKRSTARKHYFSRFIFSALLFSWLQNVSFYREKWHFAHHRDLHTFLILNYFHSTHSEESRIN